MLSYFVVLGSIFVTPVVAQFLALCLIWAPVASLICVIIARLRGLDAVRHAATGFVFSILLFLPWVYLVVRMFNKRPPRFLVVLGYGVVYALLLWGPILNSFFMLFLSDPPPGTDVWGFFERYPAVAMTLTIMNTGTWIVSVQRVLAAEKRTGKLTANVDDTLPSLVYIMPFLLATFWFTVDLFIKYDLSTLL